MCAQTHTTYGLEEDPGLSGQVSGAWKQKQTQSRGVLVASSISRTLRGAERARPLPCTGCLMRPPNGVRCGRAEVREVGAANLSPSPSLDSDQISVNLISAVGASVAILKWTDSKKAATNRKTTTTTRLMLGRLAAHYELCDGRKEIRRRRGGGEERVVVSRVSFLVSDQIRSDRNRSDRIESSLGQDPSCELTARKVGSKDNDRRMCVCVCV